MLKSFAQQDIEQRYEGRDIKDIVIDQLERVRGKPYMMAQAAVALMISEPTLRTWCEDMGIDIKSYRNA